MSLPLTTGGYALGPDDGEALWFNGALLLVKATSFFGSSNTLLRARGQNAFRPRSICAASS